MKKPVRVFSSKTSLLLFIFVTLFLPLSGQAVISDSLRDEQVMEIQKLSDHNRVCAQRWWYGWLATYSVATVGQGIVYFTSDNKATRQDMALGSATTLLGALGQLMTPLVPRTSPYINTQITDSITGGQYLTQKNQEEILREIALREKAGRSWKVHVVTGAVNIGSGLITWLGFNRTFRDGVENFLLNTVITEAQIWTQPVRASKDYENYCRKYPGSGTYVLKPDKEWTVNVYRGGVSVKLCF